MADRAQQPRTTSSASHMQLLGGSGDTEHAEQTHPPSLEQAQHHNESTRMIT